MRAHERARPNLNDAYHTLEILKGPDARVGLAALHPTNEHGPVIRYGTLDEHADELLSLNAKGHGIFYLPGQVSAKAMDAGKWPRAGDIDHVGSLWADLDHTPEGELSNYGRLLELQVSPSIIVETSPGRLQAHFRLTEPLPASQAKALLRAIAQRLGGDPQVCTPNKFLRLPGFLHTKNPAAWGTTRLLEVSPERKSLDELIKGLNLEAIPGGKPHKAAHKELLTSVPDSSLSRLEEQARLERFRTRHAEQRAAFRSELHLMFGQDAKVGATRGKAKHLAATLADALGSARDACGYVEALAESWPRGAGLRNQLALTAGSDLHRFGYDLATAQGIVEAICQNAGDREVKDRLRAVREAYTAIREGRAVQGSASSAPNMTTFAAVAWGCDLRKLSPSQRREEARRRVLLALDSLATDDTGKRLHSSRTLAERTGINFKTVNEVLNQLHAEGLIERMPGGSRIPVQPAQPNGAIGKDLELPLTPIGDPSEHMPTLSSAEKPYTELQGTEPLGNYPTGRADSFTRPELKLEPRANPKSGPSEKNFSHHGQAVA
jgi:predicted transcriptional regulator